MSQYVYIRSEPNLWTVGHYDPAGKFVTESDHEHRDNAANRVMRLNGRQALGGVVDAIDSLGEVVGRLCTWISDHRSDMSDTSGLCDVDDALAEARAALER